MKRILVFLFFCSFAIQASAQTEQEPDSLNPATRMRPNDILKEDIRWNKASVDLFTYWFDSGLYGFYGPQPAFMIDGIPVDINYFGWQNINMLPLLVDDINHTKTKFTPGVHKNSLASSGFIDLETAIPDTGFSLSSSYYIGNESGDPGPYIFDSLNTTPNIDRWGPDGSISLAYRKNNVYAKGLFSFRNHQQTDLISNQRIHLTASVLGSNQQYVNYKIQTTTKSGLLETGYNGSKLNIKARAIFGEDKDYSFLQAYGREIPTLNRYEQFAIDSKYQTGNWLLYSRYIIHNKTIGKRYDLHNYIFNWQQTSHTFSTSATYDGAGISFTPGITYERLQTKAPGIDEPYNDLATFFLDGRIDLGARAALNLHGNLDYDEEEWAQTLRIGLPVQLSESWQATPAFFFSELLPLRQNSFPYWTSRGYNFADELGITVSAPFESFKNRLISAKLTNTFSISNNWKLTFEQQLLHHDALNIPWQIVEEYEFTDTRPGRFTATQEQGNRLKVLAQVTNQFSDLFSQQLQLLLQQTVSGTKRYRSYFNQIPETKISYNIDINPVNDLTLSLNTSYRSSTTWAEFEALEGVAYKLPSGIPIRPVRGIFHSETPSFTNISLGVQKWFWDRHLNAQFSVQNLLNQEVRYHPMGAELFTKFNIQVGLQF